MLCNGALVLKGPMENKYTPNLNGEKRFLRGGAVADALNMEEDAANVESLAVKDRHFNAGECGVDTQIGRSSSGTCRDCSWYLVMIIIVR